MAYFIYTLKLDDQKNVVEFHYVEHLHSFKEAKTKVRALRAEMVGAEDTIVKIVFAEDRREAEARLSERREAPILKEWEK